MQSGPPKDQIASEIERLQRPLRGRRWFSWFLFIGVLVVCLIIPGLASLAPVAKSTMLKLDQVWNTGVMSGSHKPWAKDCKVCHSTPFARVQDADCMVCHKAIGAHVDRKIVTVGALHEVRCAACHRDHQGEFGLGEQNQRYTAAQCANCHGAIEKTFPNTATRDVTDFARGHPAFRLQLATGSGHPALTRTRQGDNAPLLENTTLKFPHDVHLREIGISSPRGPVKMNCADCHKQNSDQTGFLPVTMKTHCESCHALKFEPAVSNREVPHGSVEEVLSTLREFYSYVGMHGVPLDTAPVAGPVFQLRPGKSAPMQSFVKSSGDVRRQAAAAATQLFEKTSCVVCHEVTRLTGAGRTATSGEDLPQWRIAPVAPQHAWMPEVQFSHAKHATAQCVDCHKAASSKKASDVLMPAIRECRECHGGNRPEKNKVTSDCGLCHGFHVTAKARL